ncbi:hypothetical protein NUW54_g55 [Trametes sanguinea]|uniref:Uncharacterized protein n=1 Tax=Trametes sanguinea TaxID=158606 RepID=A0ACC1QD97_9APHY|nr:hypothetical protein NUW54_g55 [Trametes sanguinea]
MGHHIWPVAVHCRTIKWRAFEGLRRGDGPNDVYGMDNCWESALYLPRSDLRCLKSALLRMMVALVQTRTLKHRASNVREHERPAPSTQAAIDDGPSITATRTINIYRRHKPRKQIFSERSRLSTRPRPETEPETDVDVNMTNAASLASMAGNDDERGGQVNGSRALSLGRASTIRGGCDGGEASWRNAINAGQAASHTRSEESTSQLVWCKRNENGQLVLPTGRFVPRSLPGRSMRDRVLEWHRRQSFASDNCSRPEVDSSSPKSPSARSNIASVSADPPRTMAAHIGQQSERTSRQKADLSGQSASSSAKQSNGQRVNSESSEAHQVKQLVVEPSGRSATERSNRPRDNPVVRILEHPRRSTAQQAALDFEEQAADIERQIASLRAQVDSSTPSKPVVPGRSASAPVITPPSAVVSSLRPSPSPSPSRTHDQQEADSYPVGRSPVEDPAIVDHLAVLAPDVLRQRIESSDSSLGHSATFDSSQLPQVDLDHVHAAFFTLQDGVDTLRTPSHPSAPSGLMCRSYPVASEADQSMHTSSSQVDPPPYASSCTPSRPYFA